jgi:hypothetical protein
MRTRRGFARASGYQGRFITLVDFCGFGKIPSDECCEQQPKYHTEERLFVLKEFHRLAPLWRIAIVKHRLPYLQSNQRACKSQRQPNPAM